MQTKEFFGNYSILDYNVSHRVLLLRGRLPDSKSIHSDIIFEGVFYIEMPTQLEGFVLYMADDMITSQVISTRYNYPFYPQFNQAIYVLESEGKKYFVGCVRVLIKESNMNYMESSIK